MSQATDQTGREHGVAEQASAKMHDAAGIAQEKAGELREQGSARLRDQLDDRSTRAGSQMRSVAAALRRSGDDLRSDENASAARLADGAADRLDQVGSYLEERNGEDLLREVESFARRRPWLLAGVGMLAGITAARFLKASSEDRYTSANGGANGGWPARTGGPAAGYQGSLPAAAGGDGAASAGGPSGAYSDDPLARDPYGTR